MARVKYLDRKPNMTNALILNDNKHALLVHNCKNGSNRYEFPGGKLDYKDKGNLVKCVEREVREELGIDIVLAGIDGPFGDYYTQTPEGEFLCRTFFAEIFRGIPKIPEAESHKLDWFGYVDYAKLEQFARQGTLVPNLVEMLPDLRRFIS